MSEKILPEDLGEAMESYKSCENEQCTLRNQDLVKYFPERPGEFLYRVIESANVWISFTDCEGRIRLWNQYAEGIFGIAAGEVYGKDLLPLLYSSPEERDKLCKDLSLQIKETGKVLDYVISLTTQTGKNYHFSLNITPWMRNEECLGYLQVGVNLTEVQSALEDAEVGLFSFRTIFELAADLMLIVNAAGMILKCNSRIEAMLGYATDEVEGESIDKLVYPQDVEELRGMLKFAQEVGNKYNGEYRFVNSLNNPIDVEINAAFLKCKSTGGCVLMLVRDITERNRAQEELRYLTLHDYMTGLYNRRYFEDELQRLDIGRHGPVTIISCDVDGLKLANDTLGHNKGDEIIKGAAEVIAKSFRSSDVVARVGGDEFGIILPYCDEEIANIAKSRIKASLVVFNRENPDIPLSLSIGSATSNSETSLEKLYYESDMAMYRDKASRGSRSLDAIVKILMLALDEKDFVSRGHVDRVRKLSADFGEALSLSTVQLYQLDILAQIHDIGKIGVPEEIISKPGRLTEEERREIEKHSELGYKMAASTPELARVADALVQHHEWWNGEGYPNGLKGEQILLLARIFAIVDAYDAMTSYRPYRELYSSKKALKELKRGAGTQFDPQLVEVFEKTLDSGSE